MRKFGIALIAFGLVLTLAACTRSASQPPVPSPTAQQGVLPGTPNAGGGEPTDDPMVLLQQFATQTALAASGGQPAAITATPDAGATSTPNIVLTTPDTSVLPSPTPQSAVTVQAPTQGPRPTTYTLHQGEFPYCLARRFNVDPSDLLLLNGWTINTQPYQPDTVVKIPQSGNPFPSARALKPHPATYTAALNDTIYSIACLYGDVDPMGIAASNGLAAPYTLKVGQTLNIP